MSILLKFLLNLYQRLISPLLHLLLAPFSSSLNACRFTPTCSQYTKEAIQKYGIITGLVLGTKRLLRCHPHSSGGHDPVPELNNH